MFTTTNLRRGMIPKDRRGMLSIESWGKSHVSPLSFAHHHLSYSVVSWGSDLLAERPLRSQPLHDTSFGMSTILIVAVHSPSRGLS